jgi:dTDP-4-amino-4,6-dideoxygalactose transaminase
MESQTLQKAKNTSKRHSSFPFLDLKAQFSIIREEVKEAVDKVLESQLFILGPELDALERELRDYLQCGFAVGCASGSDAILLALMALDLSPHDEVITTPFTFVATAGSISRLGARPVFVDIDSQTYNIDVSKIEAAITPRTRAIMPVHLFGLAADMEPILDVARKHKLAVIEDAAQAISARYKNVPVGSLGTFGCFSFFPSKNLGGAGDGGLITANDPGLADKLKVLRTHGSRTKYNYEALGMNSRLDALQAAILRVKLRHLDEWTSSRQTNAKRYSRLCEACGLGEHIRLPAVPGDRTHVFNQFVIRSRERDALRQHLSNCGVLTEIYYPLPLHLQPAFAYLDYGTGDFPEAETASKQVLALPIFPELAEKQQVSVVEAIAEFYDSKK